jgi:hypothetical protein
VNVTRGMAHGWGGNMGGVGRGNGWDYFNLNIFVFYFKYFFILILNRFVLIKIVLF